MRNLLNTFKAYVKKLNKEILVLYYAYKDTRTPFWIKALAISVVAYALSPIDLIPDFIPILGYLDDLIIVPLGIMLCIKLIPDYILEESRQKALQHADTRLTKNWYAGILIILLWIVIITLVGWWIYNAFYH